MTNSTPKSQTMLSLRISRWRQPRLSWLAVILVAVLFLGFGVVANALHPELSSAPVIELENNQ